MDRICVFGAGAIGGYMAALLAASGREVAVIARGDQLRAIRASGITLRMGGREITARVNATDNPAEVGPQDLVICALKAHQAHESAPLMMPLLGPDTPIVTAMNGIPWWYFYKHGGPFDGRWLESVDRAGRQWTLIGPQRAIGCVVDPACEVVAPGVIEHREFNRFTLGEPSGVRSDRVQAVSRVLIEAGFDAPIRDNIRWNVWLKLWGNVCFNPISALTRATLDRIAGYPELRALCVNVMQEARAVSGALGVDIPGEMVERRLNAAASVTGHKMSMLQDLERGRSMEIDALVSAVEELGRWTSVPTPTISVLLALVKELGRRTGLYEGM
jgi:2-dehydropantoate 2-reductase